MENNKRGGSRPGAGRPKGDRNNTILIKVNDDALEKWKQGINRTDQIEGFILSQEFKTK